MPDKVSQLKALLDSLRSEVGRNSDFQDNMSGDGNIRIENGRITLSLNNLSTDRQKPGPTGVPGATGRVGDIGHNFGLPGATGPTGIPGFTGPTGPKGGIVKTELGNVAFSCFEGNRPFLFNVYHGRVGESISVDERLLASVVPGSLHVKSVVPVHVQADLAGSMVNAEGEIGEPFTVVIAGVNRHFPDWDNPMKTDKETEFSWRHLNHEWRN